MISASLRGLCLSLLATAPVLAGAQWSANLSLTSNYKFRGQDQDSSRTRAVKPALQGGFDYAFGDSGWYLGNWNSSVHWLAGNSLEMDVYGGYKFQAASLAWDLGALTYVYPGNTSGNTTELYAGASRGPLSARYSHTVSRDYFGWAGAHGGSGLSGRGTGYLLLGLAHEVLPGTTLKAALGYTHFASDIRAQGVPHYVDWQLGAAHELRRGLSLGASVTGASRKAFFGPVNDTRLILSLTQTL